jgi:ketosteroid isomerase-like protein
MILNLVAAMLMAVGPQVALSDSADVVNAVNQFHDALARADSAAALNLLSDDVRILEAGGLETKAEYRGHHLRADIDFASAVKGERTIVAVAVSGQVAWVVSSSASRGTFRERPVDSVGAELIVLVRTAAGWRITAIHWSSRRRAS